MRSNDREACPQRTHNRCINEWNFERFLDNQPQPILQHTRRYYEKTKNVKSLASKASELISRRNLDAQHKLLNTLNDIEQISFCGNNDLESKERRGVSFADTFGNGERNLFAKDTRLADNLQSTDAIRKYKYYFMDHLRQGHPKYSPYKMHSKSVFSETTALSTGPYLRHGMAGNSAQNMVYSSPPPNGKQDVIHQWGKPHESESPRFNYTPSRKPRGVKNVLFTQSAVKPSSISSKQSKQRIKNSGLALSETKKKHHSKSELRSMLHSHKQEIIQYLTTLI